MQHWTAADMPDQTGRTAVVTGASSGLGLAVTKALSARGAQVTMAVRNPAKAERIRAQLPDVNLVIREPDLSDLDSVRAFAAELTARGDQIDVLVNNAGIGNQPQSHSPQGHELHFATNHLGHFLLTALLLENLAKGNDPRVVTVASLMYRYGRLDFDNLPITRGYTTARAYSQSKLANVLFALELDRRLRAAKSPIRSMLTHPGIARTPMLGSAPSPLISRLSSTLAGIVSRPVEQGALPIIFAAAAPNAPAAVMLTPGGILRPHRLTPEQLRPHATNPTTAATLWTVSETLTNTPFPTDHNPTT
ncbi:SDR family NAD(P)-dependent oxidoreductase [Crossiella sp. CA-258035]|uniref:SDR family NAD(P)-dependent oxidoreductase n=1 Tax=Crossiella sp. CA-258035 TaxID=2981138 RepID=UPI0024BBFB24|nr:SDR family NAD(P)-dependent oxidoreductase [Crossiella sp. CA-258035]WHT22389.1 SDR family NAD(P)-dependent oxidoreductase [Crossiella sp. CA-258035]